MSVTHMPPDISPVSPFASPPLERLVPSSARRRPLPRKLRRAVGPLALLALWQLLSSLGVLHADVLASPGTIAEVGAGLIADGTLPSAMGVSLQRAVAGLLIGGFTGIALALVSGLSRGAAGPRPPAHPASATPTAAATSRCPSATRRADPRPCSVPQASWTT